ncbi:MAG TPA: hypothetical protein VFM67_10615, partial [Gaiella sp.]|nr:hypothetical protein [Gaiella sp.]
MVTEHVFDVKQPDTTRITVVARPGFTSAETRKARVCLPGLRASRRIAERFASTRPVAQTAVPADVRARRALESVWVPLRRHARAETLSAAETPITIERRPSRTVGVPAPRTARIGCQRAPFPAGHARWAIASCTAVRDGRGVPSTRTSPA